MNLSKLMSTINYKSTERLIEEGNVKIQESERVMNLYQDRLVSPDTTFKLENVWDVSYKSFSGGDCLLYLHTHRGVLTYRVQENPKAFVFAFKKIKNINY